MSFGRSNLVGASPWVRYAFASGLVASAAFLRVGMSIFVTRPLSSPLFITAIILATWTGGMRLGIFSSLASALVVDYFFAQPRVGDLTLYDHTIRSSLFFAEGVLISLLIDRLRLASDDVATSRAQFRELSEYQRSERDAELKRISREIHDELGQTLTSLKLDFHLLRTAVQAKSDTGTVLTALDDVVAKVDDTIADVRRISSELRPSILDDFGLVAALEWQVKEFSTRTGTECEFKCDGVDLSLDSDTDTGLFRITQEALTNVARHAEATRAHISLLIVDGVLRLRIEDNGRGIEVESVRGTGSLGLLGMRERARLLGGNIEIKRVSEWGGTLVELVVPLNGHNLVNEEVNK